MIISSYLGRCDVVMSSAIIHSSCVSAKPLCCRLTELEQKIELSLRQSDVNSKSKKKARQLRKRSNASKGELELAKKKRKTATALVTEEESEEEEEMIHLSDFQ